MGGILPLPIFLNQFPQIDTTTNDPQKATNQGITVASYNLGCFFGAIATIWLGNFLGRKRTIFTGSAIMIVGAILQCTAFQLPHFIVGRIITGLGNGLNTSTVRLLIGEILSSQKVLDANIHALP